MGFALTAYPIGAERGWVPRAAAARRALSTLEFFWHARQDTARTGSTGYRGFFYHFLDASSGVRFKDVELSTIDTALLLYGALFCQSYFDRDDPREARVRALAESLYARADWNWAQVRPPRITHGWSRSWRSDRPPIRSRPRPGRYGSRPARGAPSTARSTSASRRSSATSTPRCGSTWPACRTA